MAVFFSGRELIDMAIGVERNGLAFYETLVQLTEKPDARVIYDYLAGEEKKHLVIFQEMGKGASHPSPLESYPGEHALYLKALVDSNVFTNKEDAINKARQAGNEMDALNIGMGAEKDSILFYSEMQNMVKESDSALVGKVMGEEKSHLRQLNDLRQVLEQRKGK